MRAQPSHRDAINRLSGLLAAVAGGDRAAFADLYQATSAKLFGITLRILKRRELAEEILQEVYVRIWQRAGDFDPGRASPITWMAIIARNRALDEARKRQLPVTGGDDDMYQVADDAPTPERDAETSDEARRLEACLGQLDEPRQSMVRLAYLDGLSRDDLAARFDKPVGTIKTWLRRSLQQLRDCLDA